MVKGLKLFQEHFRGYEQSFVIIGGAACDEWFSSGGLRFRATKDIDMVLILEALSPDFFDRFWEFIKAGTYNSRRRATGERMYFRFEKPGRKDYPGMIELFSRQPESIALFEGQGIIPLSPEEDVSSLSAILMDDAYYDLINDMRDVVDGLPAVKPAGLLVLKARAWLDMKRGIDEGKKVAQKDVDKHRNDIFRLAALLPAGQTQSLSPRILDDLRTFLEFFPSESSDWKSIMDATRATGSKTTELELLGFVRSHFGL